MSAAAIRIVIAGALLTLPVPAACLAADWQRVPAAGNDQHFYDRSMVTISGDEVTYWRKVVFARPVRVKGGFAKTALYRERMQCHEHTLRALSWQLFADEGAVIEASTVPEADAASIVPETVGDRFQEFMCALAEARRKHDADVVREEAQLATRRKELETLKAEIEHIEAALAKLREDALALQPKAAAIEAPNP